MGRLSRLNACLRPPPRVHHHHHLHHHLHMEKISVRVETALVQILKVQLMLLLLTVKSLNRTLMILNLGTGHFRFQELQTALGTKKRIRIS